MPRPFSEAEPYVGDATDDFGDLRMCDADGTTGGKAFAGSNVSLQLGDIRLAVSPSMSGGILNFSWRDIQVFRPYTSGEEPIDLASFPLVPFCNRIADRRLVIGDHTLLLPAAPVKIEPRHAIHGVGWTDQWLVAGSSADAVTLTMHHDGTRWPWAFAAAQNIVLNSSGFTHQLSLTNTDKTPMPAGLGLHPYFPAAGANLRVGATGYWRNGTDRLPERHLALVEEPDWFEEAFDHCFTGSHQPVELSWPTHRLRIHTSPNLPFTHVFTPPGADYFCVEPVSQIPDAVNSSLGDDVTGLKMLAPSETMEIECRFELEATG